MGYRSVVAIELIGYAQEVAVVLKTYAMGETEDDIAKSNHILDDKFPPRLTVIEFEADDKPALHLIWEFEDTKWYEESIRAIDRLSDVVDNMYDSKDFRVGLYFTRTGEEVSDVEEWTIGADDWGKAMFPYSSINCYLPDSRTSKARRAKTNQFMEELCTLSFSS